MPLHPEIAKIVANLPEFPSGPIDPAVLRAGEAAMVPPLEERLPLYSVEDVTAHTPAGEVPVRIYTPVDATSHGVLVYFHGGAFFLGSLDTHDHVARSLAKVTGLKVVSVGFRLAPENAFPAGLEDCLAVVRWVTENGERLGWDEATLAVAGDSSGGNFVAAVCGLAHDEGFDRITHQVLYYPSLDLDFDVERYPSLRENSVGYGLETAGLGPFNAFYVDGGADPADARVSPIKREDLSGVVVTVGRYAGANHGFVQNFSWIPDYHRVFEETATFLGRRGRGAGSMP
jgi:acetyl esterase